MLPEDAREDGLSDIIGSARGRVKEYRNASLHFPPNGGYWAFPSPWKTCVCNNCKYTLIFTPIQAWCERSRVDWYVGRSGCRFYCDIQASLWRSRSGRSVLDICKGRLELLSAHVWWAGMQKAIQNMSFNQWSFTRKKLVSHHPLDSLMFYSYA